MRPSSSINGMISVVPGTAFNRPPTGGARLATARLRTGINPTTGMQAAQGFTLGMNINVQDRPMTGQGLGGLRLKTGTGRIVEDAAYFIGILRNRINDITIETKRLQKMLDSNIKESTTLANLEKKHEKLLKEKEIQEGQLADFNLALDKTRTSTDPETVSDQASEIVERNKQTRMELDRIFALRKDRELELNRVEEHTEQLFRDIQNRVKELDPSKQRIYKELCNKQKEFESSIISTETQLSAINEKIDRIETDNLNNPHRKEYLLLENQYQQLRRELEGLDSEAEIMQLPAKEAQAKYVARVIEFKQGAKTSEEKAAQLRDYISVLKGKVRDLDKKLQDQKQPKEDEEEEQNDALLKRQSEIDSFLEQYEGVRRGLGDEQTRCKELVVALLEHMSEGVIRDGMDQGQDDRKGFRERSQLTSQSTLEGLKAELKQRQKELDLVKSSEPKIISETKTLRENIEFMQREMDSFRDVNSLHDAFAELKSDLQEKRISYIRRRDMMKQEANKVSTENESVRKSLASNEVHKDLEETEKKLRHFERTIFELNEFVDSKTRETDFQGLKTNCLQMINQLNSLAIKKCAQKSSHHQEKW